MVLNKNPVPAGIANRRTSSETGDDIRSEEWSAGNSFELYTTTSGRILFRKFMDIIIFLKKSLGGQPSLVDQIIGHRIYPLMGKNLRSFLADN
jgi:hypothetical protein